MNDRQPQLSWHAASGQWFCKWNGQWHYFGADKAIADVLYAESMVERAKWRLSVTRAAGPRRRGRRISVWELYDRFIHAKQAEHRPVTVQFYRGSLRRFVALHKLAPAAAINAMDIQAFKEELLRLAFARKTVNHEVACIKTMIQWGIDLDLLPPVNLHGVRLLKLDPPPAKGYTLAEMRQRFLDLPTRYKPLWAVNWLTACRPSELVRVINGQGDWPRPWLFRPHEKKTAGRHIVFSKLALIWLRRCAPIVSRPDTYSLGVRRHCAPGGPHPLRHGAASHLAQLGVDRREIDFLLGHLPPRVSQTYVPADYSALLPTASRLTM